MFYFIVKDVVRRGINTAIIEEYSHLTKRFMADHASP